LKTFVIKAFYFNLLHFEKIKHPYKSYSAVSTVFGQFNRVSDNPTPSAYRLSYLSISESCRSQAVYFAVIISPFTTYLFTLTSGKFKTQEALQPYFDQGVRKVLVSAPVPEPALNVVYGINDHLYNPEVHRIVTAASCTTNCLAPIVKVMNEGLGIRHGCMTTIHDITNTQTIVDIGHKDLRRARANSQSLIPTSTGSAKAITKIFPELEGKLNGLAVRVPLLNASLTDFVFEAARETTAEEVNALFKAAADGPLKGILGYEERPLVSVDYKDDPRSSIVDALSTMVINSTQVKVLAWYDNEWGYVMRMMELARKLAGTM